jgi:cobyrinic acid a,c-diamide synthase
MPRLKQDIFPMRHLGVTPHHEYTAADDAVERLAALAETHFDLDAIITCMRGTVPMPPKFAQPVDSRVTIGVLRDAAFQFYYQENLDALKKAGAELVTIDALLSQALPAGLDGLYIGGGFPETSARQLADNESFRRSVREHVDAGLPVYAECGGLIFLGKSIILQGEEYPLAGVFPVTFGISARPQAHGYSTFVVEKANCFYPVGTRVKGHEFRYSRVQQWDGDPEDLVLQMERGTGFVEGRDGLQKKNALALYTHVMASGTPQWVQGFIAASRAYRDGIRKL